MGLKFAEEDVMRCANPDCRHESQYLRDGGLYCIDEVQPQTGARHSRFIWLCRECSSTFRVETWRPPGEQLRYSATGETPRTRAARMSEDNDRRHGGPLRIDAAKIPLHDGL